MKPKDPDQARALEIEYEATMAAIESVLHHYRILALRLEHLGVNADVAPAGHAERDPL